MNKKFHKIEGPNLTDQKELKQKTLTICIPAYKNYDKLEILIHELLKSKSTDFEIYILFNDVNILFEELLTVISDDRIIWNHNAVNIGGYSNSVRVLMHNTSKYSLLFADKDWISSDLVDKLIAVIEAVPFFSSGYVDIARLTQLNSVLEYTLHKKTSEVITKFLCDGRHFSGWIFNNRLLNYSIETLEILQSKRNCVYPHELISLDLLNQGSFLSITTNVLNFSQANSKHLTITKSDFIKDIRNVIPQFDTNYLFEDAKLRINSIMTREDNHYSLKHHYYKILTYILYRTIIMAPKAIKNEDLVFHYQLSEKIVFDKKEARLSTFKKIKLFRKLFPEIKLSLSHEIQLRLFVNAGLYFPTLIELFDYIKRKSRYVVKYIVINLKLSKVGYL